MKPLRRRQDIIDLAFLNAPTNACAAAMQSTLCKTILLGSFTAVEGLPGWVVEVTSLFNRSWRIAVLSDEINRRYTIRYLDTIPWATWDGDWAGRNPLRDGDVPRVASYERMKAHAAQIRAKSV